MLKYENGTEISVGERLQDLRKGRHLTMQQVGEQAKVSAATISNYENNITSPTLSILNDILAVYGISIFDFLEVDKKKVQSDIEVFRRYGLSKYFVVDLLLSAKLGQRSNTADCLNFIFKSPLYASVLFEDLSRFLDPKDHEAFNQLSIPLSGEAVKRALLEPVICTLIHIFDAINSKEDVPSDVYPSTAKEQRAFQNIMLDIVKELEAERAKAGPKG